MQQKKVEVIMGISGSGKSTIGKQLAKDMAIPFLDADDFHSRENVMKMSRGVPLEDDDRWPWLGAIAEYVKQHHRDHFVLSCSALKAAYRDFLNQGMSCNFHLLHIEKQEAIDRMINRGGHFMKSEMVTSQLETLEVTPDLNLIKATLAPDQITSSIIEKLK